MVWLLLTLLAGFAAIGSGVFATKPYSRIVPAVTVAAWLILTLGLSIHTVAQRQVGLVQSFSGTIGSGYKSSGVVMTAPWNHIKTENIGLQKEVFSFGDDSSGLGSAVSKDQQSISATIAVNYQVEPQNVVKLWKTVGPNWKVVLLDGRIPQAFKETTAEFRSSDITLKRPQLRTITLSRLRRELAPYDIRVVDVFVSNIGYSKEYEAGIEAKLKQQQAAQQAGYKVAQSQAEAQQRIAAAEGEAKSIELEGRALRNNPEVLKLRAIAKLAPNAEVIYCNAGDCPNIIGSLTAPNGK